MRLRHLPLNEFDSAKQYIFRDAALRRELHFRLRTRVMMKTIWSVAILLVASAVLLPSVLPLRSERSSVSAAGVVPLCGAPDDGLTHMPTDWGTRGKPAGGEGNSYLDPLAKEIRASATPCRVWEVTDSTSDLVGTGGSHCPTTNEYSAVQSPFNADNSFVTLYQSGCGNHWYIKNISKVTMAPSPPSSAAFSIEVDPNHMPFDENNSGGIIWDKTNPKVFYYDSGNALKSATITGVNKLSTKVIRKFGEYSCITTMNYPELGVDGSTIDLVGSQPKSHALEVFTFNLSALEKSDHYVTRLSMGCPLDAQPANDGIHKLQLTADNHLMIDYNGGATAGQYLTHGTTQTAVWVGGRTAHHTSGYLEDGTSSIWVSVDDPTTTNEGGSMPPSFNPCSNNVGMVYLKVSDIIAGRAPFTDHCLFANFYVQDGHVSWGGGPNQPWILSSQTNGGGAPSQSEFYWNSDGQYAPPTNACPFGNNSCGVGSWTAYMAELILIPNDCVGSATGAGCNPGASGRHAFRIARAYSRSRTNSRGASEFWQLPKGAISRNGSWAVFTQTLGYNANGCPPSIDSSQGMGCPDAYLIGPFVSTDVLGSQIGASPGTIASASLATNSDHVQTTFEEIHVRDFLRLRYYALLGLTVGFAFLLVRMFRRRRRS